MKLLLLLLSAFLLVGCDESKVDSDHNPFLPAPTAPLMTDIMSGNAQVTISWNSVPDAQSYVVKYGTSAGVYTTTASNNATSPYTITGLTNGTTYYVRVVARDDTNGMTTNSSNELSAAATAFTISSVTAVGVDSLKIAWPSITGATSYTLKYGTVSGVYPTTVNNAVSPTTIPGLSPGTTYYVIVTANGTLGTLTSAEAAGAVSSLSLDFTAAAVLDGSITYSRRGTATRTNAAGLIETVGKDVARFDYDPVTLTLKGLLLEESRQNLVKFSEDLQQVYWAGLGITTATNATAPDGTVTGVQLIADTSTGSHRLGTGTITKAASAITYTASFYLKNFGYPGAVLSLHGNTVANYARTACLFPNTTVSSTGSTGAPTGNWAILSSGMYSVGNGWYRCYMTATSDTHTAVAFMPSISDGGSSGFTGNGVDGVYLWGLQVEEGATLTSYIPAKNIFEYSEQFDQSPWVLTRLNAFGAGSTANAIAAPDGTTTADLITDTAANNTHFIRQTVTETRADSTQTFSVYAKKGVRDQIELRIISNGAVTNYVAGTFDLTNGTAVASAGGNGTGQAASITNVGGGWYRCAVTGKADSASNATRLDLYILSALGAISYAGNGSGVYLWGAQLEAAASASTYRETTNYSIRNADNAVISAPGAWYNATNGTIVTQTERIAAPAAGESRYTAAFTDGTANNVVGQFVESTGARKHVVNGGVAQTDATVAFTTTGTKNIVSAYAANDLSIAGADTLGTASAAATLPTPDRCWLGSLNGAGNYLNGHLKLFQFIPDRIPNAALKDMSR